MQITLEYLYSFDPEAHRTGAERRFCCPFDGCAGKPTDKAHRSLGVNISTGQYLCHRCGEKGMLSEMRTEQPKRSQRERARANVRRFTTLPPEAVKTEEDRGDWKKQLAGRSPLIGTDGEYYIEGRGIPVAFAHKSGARFARPYRRPGIVFPFLGEDGKAVGFNARYTDGRNDPKAKSGGSIGGGVFATAGAWEAVESVITEAPIDALSLAVCGVPAFALGGTALRAWLVKRCALKAVYLAFDADTGGNEAFEKWGAELRRFGCEVIRLSPPDGFKDWNEALTKTGREALQTFLEERIAPTAREGISQEDSDPFADDTEIIEWARAQEARTEL